VRYENINGCRTVDEFVRKKLDLLNRSGHSFENLFELMFAEKEAVLYERSLGYKIEKTGYAEAYESAKTKAAALRSLLQDAPHDAVVGIHMENSVEWIEVFWAVLAAGFRPLLMNLRLDSELLATALSDCAAVAVVADKGEFAVQTIIHTELDSDIHELRGDFGSEVLVMSTGTTSNLKVCAYGAEEFCSLINDSFYVVRECAQIKRHYKGKLKLLTFLPFYHVFGLIAMYIWFAFFSRTFVHLKDMEPQTILNTIRRHEVTHIFAVPLFWERVYQIADRTIRERGEEVVNKYEKGLRIGAKLENIPALARLFRKAAFGEVRAQLFGESVRFMITGGSPIRAEALAFFNNIGYHICNGYGMTEIGITSVELSMSAKQRNSSSVGKPLPSVEYSIDSAGELLVRGRSLARSIMQRGEVRAKSDGWFHTGDLAECVNGSYRILGRRDDIILLPNGEMLNPNLIEPRFLLPGIDGACLIDAAEGGEAIPTLLISVKNGCTKEQLERFEADVIEQMKLCKIDTYIRNIVFVTGSFIGENDFKPNRGKLKNKYLSGTLDTITAKTAPESAQISELERQVAEIFAAVLGKAASEISPDSDFFMDEGGTSLDYFALLSGLKEAYSLPFEETGENDFHSVRGICRYIEGAAVNVD